MGRASLSTVLTAATLLCIATCSNARPQAATVPFRSAWNVAKTPRADGRDGSLAEQAEIADILRRHSTVLDANQHDVTLSKVL